MSRTYRLRRLPALPGQPRKYSNARTSSDLPPWHQRDWTVLGRHAEEWELADNPVPIRHLCWHPWVGFGLAGVDRPGVKWRHRNNGERRFRRACKAVLRNDPAAHAFPDRRQFLSVWDLI